MLVNDHLCTEIMLEIIPDYTGVGLGRFWNIHYVSDNIFEIDKLF